MPAKITDTLSFEDIEEHIIFTQETLRAVPQTLDLADSVDNWFQMLDETSAANRRLRRTQVKSIAHYRLSQENLKNLCRDFAAELSFKFKTKGDPSYKVFFKKTPSRWLLSSFAEILDTVQAWLKTSEPALESYRTTFQERFDKAEQAHLQLKTLVFARNEYLKQRQEFGQKLTQLRDTLHEELAKRARVHGFPRKWPGSFFMKFVKGGMASSKLTDEKPSESA